jgi:dihydrofolate reductase
VKIIAAMTAGRVIGAGDGMPWSVPADYQHFLASVDGNAIIMGRRSWSIFGPDLRTRDVDVVVVSRSADAIDGATVARDPASALATARSFGRPEIYCAGGGSIYRAMIGMADELVLSIIPGDYDGDTYFPEIDESIWRLASTEPRDGFDLHHYLRR